MDTFGVANQVPKALSHLSPPSPTSSPSPFRLRFFFLPRPGSDASAPSLCCTMLTGRECCSSSAPVRGCGPAEGEGVAATAVRVSSSMRFLLPPTFAACSSRGLLRGCCCCCVGCFCFEGPSFLDVDGPGASPGFGFFFLTLRGFGPLGPFGFRGVSEAVGVVCVLAIAASSGARALCASVSSCGYEDGVDQGAASNITRDAVSLPVPLHGVWRRSQVREP